MSSNSTYKTSIGSGTRMAPPLRGGTLGSGLLMLILFFCFVLFAILLLFIIWLYAPKCFPAMIVLLLLKILVVLCKMKWKMKRSAFARLLAAVRLWHLGSQFLTARLLTHICLRMWQFLALLPSTSPSPMSGSWSTPSLLSIDQVASSKHYPAS